MSTAEPRVAQIALTAGEVFDMLPDALILVDAPGRIAFANAAVSSTLGYAPTDLVGRPLAALVPERYRVGHERHVAAFRAGGRATIMGDRPILMALHASGEEIPVSISIANLELAGTRFTVAVIRDASPARDQLGEAIAEAESDVLTGLGNRLCLTRRMESTLESGRTFGLLYVDLTCFKPFNDRYGHATGDEVLRLVGRRLNALVRAGDVAARVGGDEFVLLFEGLSDEGDLQVRANGILDVLGQPFRIRGARNATIGASIGGALYPRDGESERDLMAVADRNMYRAKRAGGGYCTAPASDPLEPDRHT